MLARKCPKCSAVWYTALPKCAFCGIEGVEQPTSTHTGRLPEKPVPAAQPEPEKPADAVAVAEATPVPPTSPEAAKAAEEKPPVAEPDPEPVPAAILETKPVVLEPPPAPGLKPLPPDLRKPDPSRLPPAPRVPSSSMPIIFGLLGLAACAILPVAAFMQLDRIVSIMAYLAGAILLPFAPLAWFAGRRYEDRCIDLGFHPASAGRAGRILGMTVTILISLEGSILAFLAAIRLISAGK
jgi:hypothetical protein